MSAEYPVHSEEAFLERLWTLDGKGPYWEANVRRPEEVGPLLDALTATLAGLGYSPRDQFGVRMALEEAVVNGLRHGNSGDPGKRVRVRYRVDAETLLAEVKDEGAGFNPDAVPDPMRPENLNRPGGRGLRLMRHFMTWVRYHGCGNRVTLCKHPTAPPRR
jgi:serine/threonine-protein kinase RsbW